MHIAVNNNHESWSWHGAPYVGKCSAGICRGALNLHWKVLGELIRLAPTTRVDRDSLSEILNDLHMMTDIFNGIPKEHSLLLRHLARTAALRWCIMLGHCLVIRCLGWIENDKIGDIIQLIEPREVSEQKGRELKKPLTSVEPGFAYSRRRL